MYNVTDKQRLIYDLSMQCAAIEVRDFSKTDIISLQSAMLDAFVRSVCMYSAMDSETLSGALERLKNV